MIKKIQLLFMLFLLLISLFGFTSDNPEFLKANSADALAKQYFNSMKEITPEWNNAELSKRVKLFTANGNGYLYRVFDGTQQGYFTIASISSDSEILDVIISTSSGQDPLVNNPKAIYYTLPFEFYEEDEYKSLDISSIAKKIHEKSKTMLLSNNEYTQLSVNTTYLPSVPSPYYYTYYDSFTSVQKILLTPVYYNYFIHNGCAPTASAMLLAFYDRVVPGWSDLVPGFEVPPLYQDDNYDFVENLINMIAIYEDWQPLTGTGINAMNSGLDMWFDDYNHPTFHTILSFDYTDYQHVIWGKNPAIMAIYTDVGLNSPNHAVLGMGTAVVRYVGMRLIVHYASTAFPVEYYLNPALFYSVSYISSI